MSNQYRSPNKRKSFLCLIVGLCICVYFSFHLVFGERGYLNLVSLDHEYALTKLEYEQLKAEREALEVKVVGMRADTIDVDLFEERVQVMLGVLPENAFVLTN